MRVAAFVVSFRSKLYLWSYGFTPEIQRVGVRSGWSLLGHGLEMISNGEEQTCFVVLGVDCELPWWLSVYVGSSMLVFAWRIGGAMLSSIMCGEMCIHLLVP
jgi:hypothetical protein